MPRLSRGDSDIRNAGHDRGKLDRIAQHAAPMQPSHGIGIAGISVTKPGISREVVQDKMTASGHWRPGRTSGKSGHERSTNERLPH
jgi:hypothetical protein